MQPSVIWQKPMGSRRGEVREPKNKRFFKKNNNFRQLCPHRRSRTFVKTDPSKSGIQFAIYPTIIR
jgi:hypothetical protein